MTKKNIFRELLLAAESNLNITSHVICHFHRTLRLPHAHKYQRRSLQWSKMLQAKSRTMSVHCL